MVFWISDHEHSRDYYYSWKVISWRWSLPMPKTAFVSIDERNFELSW